MKELCLIMAYDRDCLGPKLERMARPSLRMTLLGMPTNLDFILKTKGTH